MWAFGVLCYVMLCGKFPFRGFNERDLYKKISYGKYYWPSDVKISTDAQNFVRSMLTVTPSKRATIENVISSPWMKEPVKVSE